LLLVENAVCGYGGGHRVLDGLSCALAPGEILCVLGANGAGKSTLFKSILGNLPLMGGRVGVDGADIRGVSRQMLARKLGYVPQSHSPPFPFTVGQVAVMGRTAHMGLFASPSAADMRIADESLDALGILSLKDRVYTEISGGERQLTLIARAFAQQASYLLMDEPVSNLDLGNRMRVLRKIKELAASGTGVAITSHHPEHAFLIAAKVVVIAGGGAFETGRTEEILTPDLMRRLYGVETAVLESVSPSGETVRSMAAYL
jgi:iron complex transport system ATP-binding protein